MRSFFRDYLTINLNEYDNIGIDLNIGLLLLAFTVGLIAAAIILSIQKNSMIILIKRLARQNATSEEGAKTLLELGIVGFEGLICRTLISSSGRLKRLLGRVGQHDYTYEEYIELSKNKKSRKKSGSTNENIMPTLDERIDFSSARFYLKDKGSLETRNILDQRRVSLLNTALFCILAFAVYVILMFLMPDILSFINNISEN